MKTAFSVYGDRIAPVFDTSERVLVVRAVPGGEGTEEWEALPSEDPFRKVAHLAGLGVQALVCGALSRPVQGMLAAQGIRITPFVAGELRSVMAAWREGRLSGAAFAMPGCCGRRRNRCGQQRPPRCGGWKKQGP